jgi:hypothetical protein
VLVLVLENWHSDCLKKGSLVFLRVRWRWEIKLLMMKMTIQWEPVYNKTEWQWHCVLRNCSSAPSIYSSPHISERSNVWGGEDTNDQHNTIIGPSCVSRLTAGP